MSRVPRILCLLALLSSVALSLLYAQDFGSIRGVVTDPTQAAIPNAALTLTAVDTGAQIRFTTGGDGVYLFGNLPKGTYILKVSANGFKSYEQAGITINIGQTATVNLQLQVGSPAETVEVHADASALNFVNAEIKQAVPERAVHELPLQVAGNVRTAASFALLLPGVSTGASGDTEAARMGGGQMFSDDALLDGVTKSEGTRAFRG